MRSGLGQGAGGQATLAGVAAHPAFPDLERPV